MMKIEQNPNYLKNYVLPFVIKKVIFYWSRGVITINIKRVEIGLMSNLPPTLCIITPEFINRMKTIVKYEKVLKCNSLFFEL